MSGYGNTNESNMSDISQMVMGIDNMVQWGLLYQMMFIRLLNLHSTGKEKEARALFDNMVGHFYGIYDKTFVHNCELIDQIVEEPEFKKKYTPEQLLNQKYWLMSGELSRLMVRSGHAPKPDVMLIPDVKWDVPKDLKDLSLSGEDVGSKNDEEEDDVGTRYATPDSAEFAMMEAEAINMMSQPVEVAQEPEVKHIEPPQAHETTTPMVEEGDSPVPETESVAEPIPEPAGEPEPDDLFGKLLAKGDLKPASGDKPAPKEGDRKKKVPDGIGAAIEEALKEQQSKAEGADVKGDES